METATENAWDRLDDYSDTVLSKSDVRSAIDTLGGVFDEAALRTLTTKQLTCLTSASHAKPSGQSRDEGAAITAYQDARRRTLIAQGGASVAVPLPVMTDAEVAAAMVYEPEPETVGDWAGHTPKPAVDAQADPNPRFWINSGIEALVTISGENSRDHGFHDDWPEKIDCFGNCSEEHKTEYRRAIVEKLALQHEEISESLGEIRSGRDALEIYFVDKKGLIGPAGEEYPNQVYGTPDGSRWQATRWHADDVPLLKPEGFLIEQADAVIRIADLAYLVNGRAEFVKAFEIKHEYNASREYKHGRKF